MKSFKVLLMIFIFFGLVACKDSNKDSGFKKLENADNLTMIIKTNMPIRGEEEITTKIDGNKKYVRSVYTKYYLSIEDGAKYKYSKDESNQWIKEQITEKDYIFRTAGEYIDPTKFKLSWFNKQNGKYHLKYDYYGEVFGDEFAEVLLFELVIDKDVYTINFRIQTGGFLYIGNILIKDINETTIDLPTVN